MLVDVPLSQCGFADARRAIEVDQTRHDRSLLRRCPHEGRLSGLRPGHGPVGVTFTVPQRACARTAAPALLPESDNRGVVCKDPGSAISARAAVASVLASTTS
jgi:hypothetical protein